MATEKHSIPRDPSEWRPTNHFTERFRNRGDGPDRHLDGEIVRECIEEGSVRWSPDKQLLWLRATVGGVTYRLVANPDKQALVTGYPISINTVAARKSGRWSSTAIEEIRQFISESDTDD